MGGERDDAEEREGDEMSGQAAAPVDSGVLRTSSTWGSANIPERIVKKLARGAGLKYEDCHPQGGGGLCLGIVESKRRRKALAILGVAVSRVGDGTLNAAVEQSGATWLDVVGWKEDDEYAVLWDTALAVREEAIKARLFDTLCERSMNGYMVEEAKKGAGGEIEMVKVKKFDNNLGVRLLSGMGVLRTDRQMNGRGRGRSGAGVAPKAKTLDAFPAPSADVKAGAGGDCGEESGGTALFMDRKSAFEVMGRAAAGGGSGGAAQGNGGGK